MTNKPIIYTFLGAYAGDAESQYNLGSLCTLGEEIIKSERKAFIWFYKASLQNHSGAQDLLSSCYLTGDGTEKNIHEAKEWLELASIDDEIAQYKLAILYSNKQHDFYNVHTAFEWYFSSAENGYYKAKCELGFCYILGLGTQINVPVGLYWLKEAAKYNYARAQYALGEFYLTGKYVRSNLIKAYYYLKCVTKNKYKDSKNYVGEAKYALGWFYEYKTKFPFKKQLAYNWYKKAALDGHDKSKEIIKNNFYRKKIDKEVEVKWQQLSNQKE